MSKVELSSTTVDTEKYEAASVSEVDPSEVNEQRLLRKIDIRVVPWMSLLYLLNSLDHSNIGNSRVRVEWLVLLQVNITDAFCSSMAWRKTYA